MKSDNISVLDQFRACAQRPAAAIWGGIIGGIIPSAAFYVAHYEAPTARGLWFLVVLALIYSAMTVYHSSMRLVEGSKAYRVIKSLAFAGLLEGILTFSHGWPRWAAVLVLISINALELAYSMVRKDSVRQAQEADELAQREARFAADLKIAVEEALRVERQAVADANALLEAQAQAKREARAAARERRKASRPVPQEAPVQRRIRRVQQ